MFETSSVKGTILLVVFVLTILVAVGLYKEVFSYNDNVNVPAIGASYSPVYNIS